MASKMFPAVVTLVHELWLALDGRPHSRPLVNPLPPLRPGHFHSILALRTQTSDETRLVALFILDPETAFASRGNPKGWKKGYGDGLG